MFKCSDVLTLIWQEVLLHVYRWNGSGVVHEKEFHCVKENSSPGSALNTRFSCHLGRFPQVGDKCWNDATLQMNVPPQTLWGAIRKIEQWFFSRRRPAFGLFVMRLIRSQKWSAWLCSSGCTEEQLAVISMRLRGSPRRTSSRSQRAMVSQCPDLETSLFQHLICFAAGAPCWECRIYGCCFLALCRLEKH